MYHKGDNISHLNTHAAHQALSSSPARSRKEPWPCGTAENAELEVHHPPFVSTCPAHQVKPFLLLTFPCDINPMKVIIFLYQLYLAHTLRSSILFIQASLLSIHASFLVPSSTILVPYFFSTIKFISFFPELDLAQFILPVDKSGSLLEDCQPYARTGQKTGYVLLAQCQLVP